MPRSSLLVAFAFSTSLLFGQLDSGSITVTASKNTSVQPDQVAFAVDVTSGLDTSLDDVIAALAGSGITLANFNGIESPLLYVVTGPLPAPTLDWSFTLPTPISQLKATAASLSSLQQSVANKNSGFTLWFRVIGTQASPQLLQLQTCSIADLMSDARAQAQKLATATGFTLGNVVSMSSATPSSAGAFSCSLTVQFQLLRLS
jgi:hypothetical protein